MVDMLLEYRDCFSISSAEIVEDMIAAANSIPEGAPVGTIARRPDGEWLAVSKPYCAAGDTRWFLYALTATAERSPFPTDADSWPVIYDPTKPGGLIEAQRWAEWFAAERDDARKLYQHFERKAALATELAFDRALSIDLGDEWGEWGCNTLVEVLSALGVKPGMNLGDIYEMVEPLVPRPDPTAQQEPEECPCAPGSGHCVTTAVPKPPRTPRVVDRLGVDEQGSRWRDRVGDEWWYTALSSSWSYRSHVDGVVGVGNPLDMYAPYVEILEPEPTDF